MHLDLKAIPFCKHSLERKVATNVIQVRRIVSIIVSSCTEHNQVKSEQFCRNDKVVKDKQICLREKLDVFKRMHTVNPKARAVVVISVQ